MPTVRRKVQPGTTAKLRVEVDTTEVAEENGKAGAFELQEAYLSDADSVVTDLEDDESWSAPAMVERAYAGSGAATASLTATPTYSAAGGPSSENIYILEVDDSSGFLVGDFLRAQDQPARQGQVYKVLAIPDGTRIHVHCKSGGMDIVNGDTIEEVQPTGIYVGEFDLPVDDYLDASRTTAEVRIIMTTVSTGADPKFASTGELVWTFDLELDVGSRPYRAG